MKKPLFEDGKYYLSLPIKFAPLVYYCSQGKLAFTYSWDRLGDNFSDWDNYRDDFRELTDAELMAWRLTGVHPNE